ncbi:hypothetical protein OG21DRAFT_1520993 [Imleria badia]|nr:hypothetical protein OG21DRAFT_1520993 [Imleria badia]
MTDGTPSLATSAALHAAFMCAERDGDGDWHSVYTRRTQCSEWNTVRVGNAASNPKIDGSCFKGYRLRYLQLLVGTLPTSPEIAEAGQTQDLGVVYRRAAVEWTISNIVGAIRRKLPSERPVSVQVNMRKMV